MKQLKEILKEIAINETNNASIPPKIKNSIKKYNGKEIEKTQLDKMLKDDIKDFDFVKAFQIGNHLKICFVLDKEDGEMEAFYSFVSESGKKYIGNSRVSYWTYKDENYKEFENLLSGKNEESEKDEPLTILNPNKNSFSKIN